MVTVNVVVLAGSVAADPVQRRMPSGDEVTELRLSVPEAGKRLLPLPIAAWHATVGVQALDGIAKGVRLTHTFDDDSKVAAVAMPRAS